MGMSNTFPYEVIGSPFSIYVATAGTARPAIDNAPSGSWTLIGSNGNRSYAEEGVRVNIPQTLNKHRGLGSAAPIKLFRAEEDVIVQVTLADLTLEQIRYALNSNSVTETGVTRKVNLSRGLPVATVALLVRGPSPYMDGGFSQWWIPYVANSSSPELVMRRDQATTYTLEFTAIVNPNAETGEELGVLEGEDETT
jgi:hypothetical protein